MRNRRLLMMMAGLMPDPYEQQQNRIMRRINRYAAELQRREQLMVAIQKRERGEEGARPMPFARKPQ